jgi:hypothetical protein
MDVSFILARETITMLRPRKKNAQNNDINKGFRIEI